MASRGDSNDSHVLIRGIHAEGRAVSRPIVFDVDPGCDDAVMLALALASDEVEVRGITTVAGNAALQDTTQNALAVLELFDRTDVPVVPGCDRPLVEPLETAEEIHGAGGLPGDRAAIEGTARDGNAPSFILERSQSISDLSIVATGPLTNIAVSLAIDPALADRIESLHVMGGALDVPGNATAHAEYNFYADPDAAARVLRDAGPRVVGLDVTQQATLRATRIESLLRGGEPKRTMAGWLAYETPEALDQKGVGNSRSLHDPLVLIDIVADVLQFESTRVRVNHGPGPSRGALSPDSSLEESRTTAEVATEIEVTAFRDATASLLEKIE